MDPPSAAEAAGGQLVLPAGPLDPATTAVSGSGAEVAAACTTPVDRSLDDSLDDGTNGSAGKKRKVFPFHITSELKSLYRSGMIGVGVQYSGLIDTACQRTGLSKAQVKSWIKRTKYHQRKILKQDEERTKLEPYPNQDEDDPITYDHSADDEHVPLYNQESVAAAAAPSSFSEHQGMVFVENDSTHENIPSLRRHVMMPREPEGGVELNISHHNLEKRTAIRLPIVHASDLTRSEAHPRDTIRTHPVVATISEGEVSYTALPTRISSPTHSTLTVPAHQGTVQRHPPALLVTTANGLQQAARLTNEEQLTQEAARIFRKVERNFRKLEDLGYQGFAFGIHGEDTQLVNSSSISHCFTPPLISYLRAVIVAANPPPLIPHSLTTHSAPIINSSSGHVHLSLANTAAALVTPPAPPHTSNASRQMYMYEQNPTRVHQRTAIYDLNETDSYDEPEVTAHGANEVDQVRTLMGPNGKRVTVVLACDPSVYTDMDGDMSD